MIISIKVFFILFALINYILGLNTKDEPKKSHYFLSSEIYLAGLLLSILLTCK